jgi:nucleoside-diphosphate-sugar epimerase
LKLIAPIEEWRSKLFGARPLVTRHGVNKYLSDCIVSHAKACRELEFEPRPIRQAIRETLSEMQKETVHRKCEAVL